MTWPQSSVADSSKFVKNARVVGYDTVVINYVSV